MTCRIRDLRRALLGLVRAAKCARDASAWAMSFVPEDAEWPPETDFAAMEGASGEDIQAGRALDKSLRRARRLLRETRPTTHGDALPWVRCPSVSPAPDHFRCGLRTGHGGEHSALSETSAPWFGATKDPSGVDLASPPCPHCQEEGTQTARRSPRLFLRPEVAGTIMCEAHHWRAAPVQGTTCRTDESDVAFTLDRSGDTRDRLATIIDEQFGMQPVMTEDELLTTLEHETSGLRRAHAKLTVTLDRIMAAWRLVKDLPRTERNQLHLEAILEEIEIALGFGGEDGGSK